MSFQNLNKEELVEVADIFAVDLTDATTKMDIVGALAEDGVSWKMYKDHLDSFDPDAAKEAAEEIAEESAAPAPKPQTRVRKSEDTLVKMDRMNPSYSVFGYTFTRKHPFVIIKAADVDSLLRHDRGFRVATPEEVEEYYSQ